MQKNEAAMQKIIFANRSENDDDNVKKIYRKVQHSCGLGFFSRITHAFTDKIPICVDMRDL